MNSSPVVVRIEKLVPGGKGFTRLDGKVLLIPYVLPGELVEVKITQDKTQYFQGEATRVLEPSRMRRDSPCDLFQKCGGCDWLHIDYQEQLIQKKALIKEAFTRTGKIELEDFEMISGDQLGYRNRVQLHRDPDNNLGFMERNSNQIVAIKKCPVLNPGIEDFVRNFKLYPELKSKSWKKLHLFATGSSRKELDPQLEGDNPEIEVEILGKKILFDSTCFFQSNLELLPALIRFALKGLKGRTAMDLFCGTGIFGVFLKEKFDSIIAVEMGKNALGFARKNISGNNNQFINHDVSRMNTGTLNHKQIDCVLVDPPRNGLTSKTCEFLLKLTPPKIVYVSCNPVTQARDTRDFLSKNYRLLDFRGFDFYPQTSHCETVLKLIRND